MTIFLQEKEQGDWFAYFDSHVDSMTGIVSYDEPVDGAAEFCFRNPVAYWQEKQALKKREYSMVLNSKTRQMERVGYMPDLPPEKEKAERDGAWDYTITGIRNAYWDEKTPIQCDLESKLKLLKIPAFLRFANRVVEIIMEIGTQRQQDAEKN